MFIKEHRVVSLFIIFLIIALFTGVVNSIKIFSPPINETPQLIDEITPLINETKYDDPLPTPMPFPLPDSDSDKKPIYPFDEKQWYHGSEEKGVCSDENRNNTLVVPMPYPVPIDIKEYPDDNIAD